MARELTVREIDLTEALNGARQQGGCCANMCFAPSAGLQQNEALRTSARLHAEDMSRRGYFAHDSPEGSTVLHRTRRCSYVGCAVGENLSQGPDSPIGVLNSFLESPAHCENVLSADCSELGIAEVELANGISNWVVVFGEHR